jgi:hypothetical protein
MVLVEYICLDCCLVYLRYEKSYHVAEVQLCMTVFS